MLNKRSEKKSYDSQKMHQMTSRRSCDEWSSVNWSRLLFSSRLQQKISWQTFCCWEGNMTQAKDTFFLSRLLFILSETESELHKTKESGRYKNSTDYEVWHQVTWLISLKVSTNYLFSLDELIIVEFTIGRLVSEFNDMISPKFSVSRFQDQNKIYSLRLN